MRAHANLLSLPLLVLALVAFVGCSPTPVEVLSVTGPDSLLTNEPGTFTAVINEDAKPPIEYDWAFGDGADAAGNPATHTYNNAGTYTVEVTASNRGGRNTSMQNKSVVVYNPPVPAEIISMSANPMRADTRTPIRFTASVRGDTPIAYDWDFGEGTTASTANGTLTYDVPGTYTARLTVANDSGSDTRSLTVTVLPYEAAYCSEVTEMNSVFFDRNSSTLSVEARATLSENLTILQDCPNMNVRVEGLAAPGERNPQQLSEDRARAVEDYYTANDVAASRLMMMGRGRAAGMSSKDGASQYRRVDTIPMRPGMDMD